MPRYVWTLMSERTTRINHLLLREFNEQLHTRWRADSVRITITAVQISDDLRNATVRYSVLGDAAERKKTAAFLKRIKNPLKTEVFHNVKIKYTPDIRFEFDPSAERGAHLIGVLDAVAQEDARRAQATTPVPPTALTATAGDAGDAAGAAGDTAGNTAAGDAPAVS